jgi:type II secretory ATPase GspE/PulE/Tfp pilus assembly ATPase PilB-like protein
MPKPGVLALALHELKPEDAVHQLIEHACAVRASDVFLASNEDHVAVSMRHLGIVQPVCRLPLELGRRCVAHIKVMAGMDMTERRRPLDGRWLHERRGGQRVDLRISTVPTLHGEDMSLRLLERASRLLALTELGLLRHDYNQLLSLLRSPSGLIVVTGPTGAGKTTTLYACLAHLNTGQRKLNTIEDPVEYAIEGIRQSQVNPQIGVDFPELLRAVLRQGPDVIMIGEIRDGVTAETAIRAANSGHLVLATLHAPTAAGAVQSLLGLGGHAHFLASSLLGVVAQRLVRTLCPHCKTAFDVSMMPNTFDEVRQWLEPGQGQSLYGAKGCSTCLMLGYAGQTGVFEVLHVSKEMRRLIADRRPTAAIRQKAIEEGTIEFRHTALLKVAQGQTSVEEVLRAIPTEHLGLEE